MPACRKCGLDNGEQAKFCAFCGAPMPSAPAAEGAPVPPAVPQPARPAEECFAPSRPKKPEFPGWLGLGMALIVIGVVFLANPNLITEFAQWMDRWAKQGWVPRPPDTLIGSAILFSAAVGVTNLVTAIARWFVRRSNHRILGDILTSIAWFTLSSLTYLYLVRTLAGPVVVAAESVVVGVLLILYIVALATRTFSPWRTSRSPPANP
uniref:Zinc-ribbon domain-containing protein n=1 Tax=uncultured euryarchaeote Rifle_16ft_4_minimus_39 TaxID=1665197 RepID=A0A0H4TT04_9EURY|nr:hypothetical protein [uncultured euryarchaeote Rifle_16ft_4_minimus_39]